MRPSLLPLLPVVLAACQARPEQPATDATATPPGPAANVPAPADITCRPAPAVARGEFVDPEPAALAASEGRARRDSAGLHLRIAGGGDVLLANVGDEESDAEDFTRYFLVAWHPQLGLYEVAMGHYEGGAYVLVDERTGRSTRVWAHPMPSPDRSRLLVTSMDLVAAYDPNGVQVWRRDRDSLVLELQRELEWGPTQARWMDDSTASIGMNTDPLQADSATGCALLRRRAGRWLLDADSAKPDSVPGS